MGYAYQILMVPTRVTHQIVPVGVESLAIEEPDTAFPTVFSSWGVILHV
jgi:hypothetical protein